MDYALAKELKEAGFPQDLVEGHYVEKDGKYGYGPSKKTAYIPTFEELIEACLGFVGQVNNRRPPILRTDCKFA